MSSWWRAQLEVTLSQGDVLEHVPVAVVYKPLTVLHPANLKGDRRGWEETPTPMPAKEGKMLLAKGNAVRVLVLSHSCELDKNEKKGRVIVAPVMSAVGLDEPARAIVLGRQRRSLFPLYDVPELGDSYVDLRLTTSVDREFLKEARRLASMNSAGLEQLRSHVVDFLFRVQPPPG